MKRLFLSLVILSYALTTSAQEMTRVGFVAENGKVSLSRPQSSVDFSLRVEECRFTPGEYARYAQKFLGKRASLVNRVSYSIVGADVAVLDTPQYYASNSVNADSSVKRVGDEIAIDRLSSSELAQETAAKSAAERIFELRTVRQELIMGEYGDGVYGAGLEAALREIDRLESEYMEMFYGVRTTTTTHHRIVLPVSADARNTVIARFNSDEGLLQRDNIAGDIVMVAISPSDMEYPLSDIKGTVAYRYANNATVTVSHAQQKLVSRVLPIFEFGETVYYVMPR
jgi:hypothetical protein